VKGKNGCFVGSFFPPFGEKATVSALKQTFSAQGCPMSGGGDYK